MSSTFNMSKHPQGVVVFSLSGQLLSPEVAEELVDAADKALEAGSRKFLVDINNLEHVNSSGLNSLLRTFTKVRNKGGDLTILNPSASIEKLLKISKLDTVFHIAHDEDAAINELTAK